MSYPTSQQLADCNVWLSRFVPVERDEVRTSILAQFQLADTREKRLEVHRRLHEEVKIKASTAHFMDGM